MMSVISEMKHGDTRSPQAEKPKRIRVLWHVIRSVIASPTARSSARADEARPTARSAAERSSSLLIRAMRSPESEMGLSQSRIRHALVGALSRNEFSLQYQPIYCLATGRLTKAEALLRWESPTLGSIPPDEFIPHLEEMGLICEVGCWVLENTCRQAVEWRSRGLDARIALNISPRQLELDHFPLTVRKALDRHACRPEWLELELTENAVVRDFARVKGALTDLAAMGLTIAIDDFGAGYSSLAQLAELPFHALKIDRVLIDGVHRDCRKRAIVTAVIALAHELGIAITVEGVELAEQASFIEQFDSVEVQGFFYGRPMRAADIAASRNLARGQGHPGVTVRFHGALAKY
jgi:EAL domain-containing protein (putative c-di-GMP-specific phosphodiesterase class I)